jgi:solute carrier family 13 (sodium-dependent dicarboxylate transporter), member 2/3/5
MPHHPPRFRFPVPLRTTLIVAFTAVVAAGAYLLMPADMNEASKRMVIVFVAAAIFWATEVIPLFATSFCVIALQVLLLAGDGGLAGAPVTDKDGQTISFMSFFEPFSSSIIILFMGGFLLSRAVSKHHIDSAISARVLKPFAHNPAMLLFAVMGMTAFFSMWMSNTATTAMMIAIITPILARIPPEAGFARGLILSVPLGANIGGLGTPIGTPPNAVALAHLRRAGYDITFVDWMMIAVPLELVLLAIAGTILCFVYLPRKGPGMGIPGLSDEGFSTPAEITLRGKLTMGVLLGAMALWLTSGWHGIADAVVALLAAAILTAFAVLDRKDVDSIDWNILILMWGGLSLGQGMQITGLVDYIVGQPIFDDLTGFPLALIIVALAVGLSTFMSNTAAANLIIPMAMAVSAAIGGQLAILTALSCSLAMALPVSTPPNAIAFSTGRLPARSLLWVGGSITIISMIALLIGYQLVIPWILT